MQASRKRSGQRGCQLIRPLYAILGALAGILSLPALFLPLVLRRTSALPRRHGCAVGLGLTPVLPEIMECSIALDSLCQATCCPTAHLGKLKGGQGHGYLADRNLETSRLKRNGEINRPLDGHD